MSKVIMIKNRQGGVGKSTAAINLSVYFGLQGKKVLAIDFDPQANTTKMLSKDSIVKQDICGAILGKCSISDCIINTIYSNVDLVASSDELYESLKDLEKDIMNEPMLRLKYIIEPVIKNYDYIIIDCNPVIDLLAINTLLASDICLVPSRTDGNSIDGVYAMSEYVNQIKVRQNPKLRMLIFISDKERNNDANSAILKLKSTYKDKLLSTMIRHQSKPVTQSTQDDVLKPFILGNSNIALDYVSLANELSEVI
ncbi:MAG: AAA family ATPase [Erysipelotrichaceae bacterium]